MGSLYWVTPCFLRTSAAAGHGFTAEGARPRGDHLKRRMQQAERGVLFGRCTGPFGCTRFLEVASGAPADRKNRAGGSCEQAGRRIDALSWGRGEGCPPARFACLPQDWVPSTKTPHEPEIGKSPRAGLLVSCDLNTRGVPAPYSISFISRFVSRSPLRAHGVERAAGSKRGPWRRGWTRSRSSRLRSCSGVLPPEVLCRIGESI